MSVPLEMLQEDAKYHMLDSITRFETKTLAASNRVFPDQKLSLLLICITVLASSPS